MRYLMVAALLAGCVCSTDRLTPCHEEPEVCDGYDNDCDGTVDEGLRRPCETTCGSGEEACLDGRWVDCTARRPTPEVCDGRDNDCDGDVDGLTAVEFCYPGPLGELTAGACRPGVKRCLGGVMVCANAITPAAEVCDGLDNDCDGAVDEDFAPVDVLAIIDDSCSMYPYLANVKSVVTRAALDHPQHRYALMRITDVADDGRPKLVVDFGAAQAFAAEVGRLDTANGGGLEAGVDALFDVPTLAWRPGAEHVVLMFSDEVPQSYRGSTIHDVDLPGYRVHVWGHFSYGTKFPTTQLPTLVYEQVDAVFQEVCR